MPESPLILIIEDEPSIAEGLKLNLTLNQYQVLHACSAEDGLLLWKENKPDMLILDLMLPKKNGFYVLEEIRKSDRLTPILILSAKDSDDSKIKGLKMGSDDYLVKPFHFDELHLRLQKLWEKSQLIAKQNQAPNLYRFSGHVIDFTNSVAKCLQGKINLTEQECKLLSVFIENPNQTLSRDELLKNAWGYSPGTSTRTLDNFIVRFRKYFEKNPKKPQHFISRRSFGYLFIPEINK